MKNTRLCNLLLNTADHSCITTRYKRYCSNNLERSNFRYKILNLTSRKSEYDFAPPKKQHAELFNFCWKRHNHCPELLLNFNDDKYETVQFTPAAHTEHSYTTTTFGRHCSIWGLKNLKTLETDTRACGAYNRRVHWVLWKGLRSRQHGPRG